MLELERPDSLVRRVVSALRTEIETGRLQPETRLPTEHQLAERLNVSRSVIREAVAQLKSDGVLIARRGSGSYISQTPAGTVFRLQSDGGGRLDLPQLFEMRLWIETQAATTAARRRSANDLKQIGKAIRLMQTKRAEGNAAEAAAADVAFHRAIAVAAKNEYFVAFHDFLRSQLAVARRAAWDAGGSTEAQLEHGELYDAISRGDHGAAAASAEKHLRAAAERMGIDLPPSVERFATADDASPLQQRG